MITINSYPVPMVLQLGQVRTYRGLARVQIGRLTETIRNMYLRGNSDFEIDIPAKEELAEYEAQNKPLHILRELI